MMHYRNSGLLTPAVAQMGEVRYAGALVLDPVCGSGTTAIAAARLGRRFIVIDRNPAAIDATMARLRKLREAGELPAMRRRYGWDCQPTAELATWNMVDMSEVGATIPIEDVNPAHWDNGDSWIILGDAISVLRTMPDCIADLIYCDPPYGTGKRFRDRKTGAEFDDRWHWDDTAEARLDDLRRHIGPPYQRSAEDGEWLLDYIALTRRSAPGMAAYLVWCALLIGECRRVCGSTEVEWQ